MDLDKTENDVIEIILKAGDILKKYFVADNLDSYDKGGVDFATEADKEVDSFLSGELKRLYPETNFLTEETAPSDYSSMKEVDNLWVIDPLDGTTNFSRKDDNFAISIALVNKGRAILGIVYLPLSGKMYSAHADRAEAFLNGEAISVSSVAELKQASVACDWAWDLKKRLDVVRWLGSVTQQVRQIRCLGSASADLCALAEGKMDAYFHSGFKPWDVAAATLIIEKAGGKITSLKGGNWNVFDSEIIASNNIIHERMVGLID